MLGDRAGPLHTTCWFSPGAAMLLLMDRYQLIYLEIVNFCQLHIQNKPNPYAWGIFEFHSITSMMLFNICGHNTPISMIIYLCIYTYICYILISGRESRWICQPPWFHCGKSIWMQEKAVSCLLFPTKFYPCTMWCGDLEISESSMQMCKKFWALCIGTFNNQRSCLIP